MELLRRSCMLFQTEGGPKFRDLGKEDLNQNLGNRHFVLIDLWGLAVQLVVYETKNEFAGLYPALS